jgi:aryl-alcohol dehydrogenase-like predicted oxidoreductase
MTDLSQAGSFQLGSRQVWRVGYGAMQLAGPGVFGPPRDRGEAIAVLREAVESGVNHIDTCDYYGPHVVNEIIKEALYPYPAELALVTKVGAYRGDDGSWNPAQSPGQLIQQVEDNLQRLGIDCIHAVNMRLFGGPDHRPNEESVAERIGALLDCQRAGKLRHIGISHATPNQVAEARSIAEIVCVQNHYNIVQRGDEAMIDALAADGVAYVPFFPLGGFSPIQSETLNGIAARAGISPMQAAQAWLLARSPNILLIPGTSQRKHLRENLAIAEIKLSQEVLDELDAIGAVAA